MNAANFGSCQMVNLLLAKGADPNHPDGTGRSVLFLAMISQDDTNIVQTLLENGARLSNAQEQEFVALMQDNPNKNRRTKTISKEEKRQPSTAIEYAPRYEA